MDAITTTKLIGIVLGILFGTIIPFAISFGVAMKKRKEAKAEAERAKTEAEKAAAEQKRAEAEKDMYEAAHKFVDEAEKLYKNVDPILKSNGLSSGPLKKDAAMTKLQGYAMENQYPFEKSHASEMIEEIVEFTKAVNAKK